MKLIELLGANYNIHAELYGNKITINTDANRYIKDKDELNIVFDANKLLFFDPKTEMRLFLED